MSTQTWISMARYLAGEMNMKEEIAFRNNLERDPQQQTELNQMEKSWKYFNANPTNRDSGKAWEKLYNRLESDGLLDEQHPVFRKRLFTPNLKIAAVILLILAIGMPTLYLELIRNKPEVTTCHQIAEKGVSTIDLPDGSRVFLNEGAEISYPEEFGPGRSVKLRGEAFFEVMSDPANPFTVSSGRVVISVLGTSFNVKEAGGKETVEVYVETGKVKVAMENSAEFITLQPGEVGHIGPEILSSSEQSDPNYISWKTKDFRFVDEDLDRVLRELEDSYHVIIHSENVSLAELRITSTYRQQSIDAILETIGTAFGLNVSKKEDHYYLNQ
ncbi:MAG: FecR domain-containing protein [Bacteroidota bacterium]